MSKKELQAAVLKLTCAVDCVVDELDVEEEVKQAIRDQLYRIEEDLNRE